MHAYNTMQVQTTADVVQENSKLHSEVSGLQKLCTLHKQEAATAVEGIATHRKIMKLLHQDVSISCL